MYKKINKEVKLIEKLKKKEKDIKWYQSITSFLMFGFVGSAFSLFIYFLIVDWGKFMFIEYVLVFALFTLFFGALPAMALSFILNVINQIINKKNIKMYTLKSLSTDYVISKKKRNEMYKNYNKLSEQGKFIVDESLNEKSTKMKLFNYQLVNLKVKEFIEYFDNEIDKDIVKIGVLKKDIVGSVLNHIINNLNKEEYNLHKIDLIRIIDTLQDQDTKLNLYKKMSEKKEKYDEEEINKKINSLRSSIVQPKIQQNVLKSI